MYYFVFIKEGIFVPSGLFNHSLYYESKTYSR